MRQMNHAKSQTPHLLIIIASDHFYNKMLKLKKIKLTTIA